MTVFRSCDPHIARNPIAKAIERQRINRWHTEMVDAIILFEDWQHIPDIYGELTEVLALAMGILYGKPDPDSIGDILLEAAELIKARMAEGGIWRQKDGPRMLTALYHAIRLVTGSSPLEKLRVWPLAQAVARELESA